MGYWTPMLSAMFQITSTLLFFVIVVKLSGVKLDRESFMILSGLSIILGFFLFHFVLLLSAIFIIILFISALKQKRVTGRFYPPEADNLREREERDE